MFKKSQASSVPDLFGSIVGNLQGARYTMFSNNKSWHNLFHQYITSKIEESKFSILFSDKMGAPNAPLRILIGMMIIKEGFGWSDAQLFEQVNFNMLVMHSLGLTNINDKIPCLATYYNFKKALYEHQISTGEDLVGVMFEDLTREQADLFGVRGTFSRMDSKLIGSNIAKCSRLQLILSVLQVFYKDIKDKEVSSKLKQEDKEQLEQIIKQKPGNLVYGLDNKEKEEFLKKLGYLLLNIQNTFTDDDSNKYGLIVRVFSEQYSVECEEVELKSVKEIQADSLQSPFDEDASFRNKNGTKVKGYSVNLTETCNEEDLNLITDVKVENATAADNDFVEGSIERSQQIVGHIDHLNVDGAYHSEDNQQYAKKNKTELLLSGIQGKKGKYNFDIKENGQIEVTNTETGEIKIAEQYKSGKYKIEENGKYIYFTHTTVMKYIQRKAVEAIPQEEKNRRNNVEASIFQLSYFTRKNKTRYRGQIKHQMWAFNRCLWINLIRIKNYIGELYPLFPEFCKNQPILTENAYLLTVFANNFKDFVKNWSSMIKYFFRMILGNKISYLQIC